MSEKPDLPPEMTRTDDNNGVQSTNQALFGESPVLNPVTTPAHGDSFQNLQQQLEHQQTITITLTQQTESLSLWTAYMCWFPFGLLGLHQFYLGRRNFGVFYAFSGGGVFFGWLVDGLRMPSLVHNANRRIENVGCRPDDVNRVSGSDVANDDDDKPISLCDAYILWFPFGLVGLHHYYLGRPLWGVVYMVTGGLCGIGWLIDGIRLFHLVDQENKRINLERTNPETIVKKELSDAYAFALTPVTGLFGAHHFYLGRKMFGIYYMLTAGGFGFGWLTDWIRMRDLVDRANNPEKYASGIRRKYLDDASVMAFPFGFLGLHHFYLEQPKWGMLYLLTGGLCGLGWLRDLAILNELVENANESLLQEATSSSPTGQQQQQPQQHGQHAGLSIEPVDRTTRCTISSSQGSITFACKSVVLQLNGELTVYQAGPHTMISSNNATRADQATIGVETPPPYTETSGSLAPPHQSLPPEEENINPVCSERVAINDPALSGTSLEGGTSIP